MGIVGFFQLAIFSGFMFNLNNLFGFRRWFWGANRDDRDDRRGAQGGFIIGGGGLMWAVFIVAGVIKMGVEMWKSVDKLSRKVLDRVEIAILEVDD